jgi:hypothetical protein
MKTVVEDLAGVSGIGTTFDGGFQYQQGIVSIGAAFQNVGGHMSYSGTVYPFPTNYGIGFAIAHPATGLSLAVDANFPYAYANDVRAGAEWRWKNMLALRAGYRHEMTSAEDDPLSGPTFGIGAGTKAYWIDYGYLISGNQDGEHRIALTFFPGRWAGLGADPYGQGDIPSDFGSPQPKKNTPLIGPPIPKDLKKKGN